MQIPARYDCDEEDSKLVQIAGNAQVRVQGSSVTAGVASIAAAIEAVWSVSAGAGFA